MDGIFQRAQTRRQWGTAARLGWYLPVEATRGRMYDRREVVPRLREPLASLAHRDLFSLSFHSQTMLRHRQASHQELCNHEDFLTQLNRELIEAIQDAEDSSALKVRVMLQQHDVFMVSVHSPASALCAAIEP